MNCVYWQSLINSVVEIINNMSSRDVFFSVVNVSTAVSQRRQHPRLFAVFSISAVHVTLYLETHVWYLTLRYFTSCAAQQTLFQFIRRWSPNFISSLKRVQRPIIITVFIS